VTFKRVLAEKRRLLWPLAIVLVANIAVYALVVYPLAQKVAMGEQEADAASASLASAKSEYANARATVTGKSQADQELAKFYKDVLPPDLSSARRMMFLPLEQLAEQTNLKGERATQEPTRVRDSSLYKLTGTALLIGDYRNIRQYIHKLETAPEFIVLENVSLAQSENEQARGLTVTVQVATYYRAGGDGN
jgi:Tfp pilus assembly protein PilO